MKCPYCGFEESRVVDSRPVDESNSIRRRRICDGCGKRFTTYEKVETISLVVIKKDRTREQYDRQKIEDGIMRACYKRAIPIKDISDTIAFGDAKIDIPMFECCAFGVAMGSGGEEIRACADYVTDDVDKDGLYKAFVHLGLI